jgi:integrase
VGIPADTGGLSTTRRVQQETASVPTGATIADLSLAFLDAKRKHSHYYDYRTVCRFLKPYSKMGTSEFDAYCLLQVQQEFDHYGYARKQVNNMVGFVRQMFRWGEARRLVPVGQYAHLKTLEPLREGRENDERFWEVEDEVIERTLLLLPPVYQAIIRILWWTGARPKEILRMRVGDIERQVVENDGIKAEIWSLSPKKHKTAKKNKRRAVAFGSREQAVLAPYLADKTADDFVFRPEDVIAERKQSARAKRKTKVQPSQIERERNRKENPKRKCNPYFNTNVVGNALRDAIAGANKTLPERERIPEWTLYCLRGKYVSEYVEKYGEEAAALMVGHTDTAMVRKIYDKSQKRRILKQKLKDEAVG